MNSKLNIDWTNSISYVLYNPVIVDHGKTIIFLKKEGKYPGHIWIATSGSTGTVKWAGLSKRALLISAESVNHHLHSTTSDIWLNPLPEFHVGGLGIWARAHLSGAKVIDAKFGKWNPELFYQTLKDNNGTLTSLVPTQLYDILKLGLEAPLSLRAVIIGGAALPSSLYVKARELGWPILPSYGMTECCSQVATAPLRSSEPLLRILDHVSLKIVEEGRLAVKSPSLLTCYAMGTERGIEYVDPKVDGWFITDDLAEISDGSLNVMGRISQIVKICGEKVNTALLEQKLQNILTNYDIEATLEIYPDERLGHSINLIVVKSSSCEKELGILINQFHKEVLPYERIREIKFVESIQRSALGKPLLQRNV